MSHKIIDSFKKIPYQLQHLSVVQKIQELTGARASDSFASYLASTYGCLESPSALSYDAKLGLLAVGSRNGVVKVFGSPGVVLTVQAEGPPVVHLLFLPEEGRLLSAFTDGHLSLFELDPKNGSWTECSRVIITSLENEQITSLALGHGIVYVGTSLGTLYQVAVRSGRMCLGDPSLTALTSSMVLESVPLEKRNEMGVDSSIVAMESQPGGTHLLVAYAGGSVVVTIPQSIPEQNGIDPTPNDAASPELETAPPPPQNQESSSACEQAQDDAITEPTNADSEPAPNVEATQVSDIDASTPQASKVPVKSHSERRATQKIKDFTRSLRRFELGKHEVTGTEPIFPVPPAPRVSHMLLRDQPVEWATWRVSATDTQPNEIIVAYGDGAFQIWPITVTAHKDVLEPVIVPKRDPPNTPYGPLPCGAIKKIIQSPGLNGSLLTAFSGGLPRAEFHDRHAVTVMQDHEHHVCFQFGSQVVDFILVPQQCSRPDETVPTAEQPHTTGPCAPQFASALLVLTERELVGIDLQQPNWPAFSSPYLNCLDLSQVTAITHITKVSSSLLSRLRDAVRGGEFGDLTRTPWPVWGGGHLHETVDLSHNDSNDLVVLGHANGWVTLWRIGRGDSVHRLGTIHTDALFNVENLPDGPKCRSPVEVETWPPFRRVGDSALADAFCGSRTDPRLTVTHLVACATADAITLVVAGAAGQVSLWTCTDDVASWMSSSCFEPDVARIHACLVTADVPGSVQYIWKGPPPLRPFEGVAHVCSTATPAFSPCGLIQLDPPAPVTAVALELAWHVLAVGSPHGFVLIDLLAKTPIHTEFMYTQSADMSTPKSVFSINVSSMQTALANRKKQITAQMRQSFRRLKQGLSQTNTSTPASETPSAKSPDEQADSAAAQTTEQPQTEATDAVAPAEVPPAPIETDAPVESAACVAQPAAGDQSTDSPDAVATEATATDAAACDVQPEPVYLTTDEFTGSTVRCLLFADTFVVSPVACTAQQQPAVPSPRTPSVWVGTTNGRAVAYGLSWDGTSGPVKVQLLKELQLHHRAPVIGLCVIDAATRGPILNNSKIRTGFEVVAPIAVEESAAAATEVPKEEQEVETASTKETTDATTPSPVVATAESHQLLVCSEEQVKLFQLPSLRALHKHKFLERLRRPGHHGSITTPAHVGSSNVAATEVSTSADTKGESASAKDASETTSVGPVTETESKSSAVPQPNRQCIRACGVQAFPRGTSEQPKLEWNVVLTRNDGKLVILSLPHLRKVFKVPPIVDSSVHTVPVCVSSLADANFVFYQVGCQLLTNELSVVPRLISPAALIRPGAPAATAGAPQAVIHLPEWARPQPPPPVSAPGSAVDETSKTAELTDAGQASVPERVVNGATEVHGVELLESTGPLDEKYEPTAVLHAGDVTLDSVKDYLNGQGTVTIKTIETSSEKHTLVEGGHVVTTLRETERVDGQVTKDDVLKFSTEDTAATPQAITETA